jgi:SecD/SecF fusion protein
MSYSRQKIALYAVLILVGILLAVPNLLSRQQLDALSDWLPKRQVALGLDLRGGSHLLLEIDTAALIRAREESLADTVVQGLRDVGIQGSDVTTADGAVAVALRDGARLDEAVTAIRQLTAPMSGVTPDAGGRDLQVTAFSGKIQVKPTEAAVAAWTRAALEQSLEIVRRRVDETGVVEPTIMRQGTDRLLIQLPGVQDPGLIKALLGTTAKMTFHLLDDGVARSALQRGARLPPGVDLLPGSERGYNELYPVKRRAMLEGDRLVDAGAGFDQRTGEPVVNFRFDSRRAQRFAEVTRANVGKPFAIVLDGKVLSAPVIREPITGGSGQISGSFTTRTAHDLAVMLRAGALPAPLKVIEERTVGPDLGSNAIQIGLITGAIGFALVFAFMMVLYGAWGLVANLALALNVILTFAALSVLGATLTLPGIAGIVLGIGLAVDANVLINERIREETRRGRGAIAALQAGFDRAFGTIVDSNLTTLIATMLLFWFGSGPVRGFAVTMGLGIVISMFTAVSVVRVLMTFWVRWYRPARMVIRPLFGLRLIPDDTSIQFMRARFAGIAFSIVLSLASVGLFFKPGLNYGIDFMGGSVLEVETQGPADLTRLRSSLEGLDLGEVGLQEFGAPDHVLVRIERPPGGEEAQTAAVEKAKQAIIAAAPEASFERVEVVGPKVSGELHRAGFLAVALASLAMMFYIWFRFEWQFAIGAVATLVLDLTKTVGFFSLTGLDFNLSAIAALLTLIGYSVNDKVVVYDRMRENLRFHRAMRLRELIDLSINQTLARSLYTSATAFLAMVPMALAGGSAVSSFAIPMLFGIVICASSSVFIAAPILLFLGRTACGRSGV